MARPIWKGTISFGLVNIPVTLFSATSHTALNFHLLDKRNHARIQYERINAVTKKEVPWHEIVKAYEFEKGNYVIVDEKELEKTIAENTQTVEIENFIDQKSLDPIYYEKPYFLVPTKQGEKGYVLLREILKREHKVGIVKVVLRTREYLAALLPYKNCLVLNILRYYKEINPIEELNLTTDIKQYKITSKEIDMAEQLVVSMTEKWDPRKYHDKNRELLKNWIQKRIKKHKSITAPLAEKTKGDKGQVIDFMTLLKKSLHEKGKIKRRSPSHSHGATHKKKKAK